MAEELARRLQIADPHARTSAGCGRDERPNPHSLPRRQRLVGIQDQDPLAGGLGQGHVPCRGEIVLPSMPHHPGAVGHRDVHGVVLRPGIHYDDLFGNPCHASERIRQNGRLVLGDHTQRQRHSLDPRRITHRVGGCRERNPQMQ